MGAYTHLFITKVLGSREENILSFAAFVPVICARLQELAFTGEQCGMSLHCCAFIVLYERFSKGVLSMRRQSKNLKADFNVNRTDLMRDKLIREISDYERHLAELKLNGNKVDFTMIQTYKELISARQDMLRRLPVHY